MCAAIHKELLNKLTEQEKADLLGALNLVIKGLDAQQKDVLKRYILLYEKIENAAD